ncbi:F0F1 ATP synthase subunit gamma [Actinocorallia sp. A-T 12471]|uniref:F0F1 ATP synthase subunit gamma n=1 Tax=Actinocorallia sp. A-T 12471 TaxID=3089813 RepID=UPI0029CD2AE2|nr:F0F1 ATP synthase subunit gamma [Actinocorallia sp. A-T 12471]MDX6740554.1 F0F1 ATP synthase subunit gamma [Actinocorallia sp. A-T 12471]
MGAELRKLRGRIRSISATAKITRAQELIAASRISRAQARQAASRPYARQITRAVSALLTHNVHEDHALLNRKPDASRVAIFMITGDRGFCGAYNANVLRHANALEKMLKAEGREVVFYLFGGKGVDNFLYNHRPIERYWTGESAEPSYATAAEIGRTLVERFDTPTAEGGVGEVHVIYTRFVSMISQELTVRRILPLEIEDVEAEPGEAPAATYDFEPTIGDVLDALIQQYVRGRIWNMLLESAASEHAARRQAMMAATDNANDLIFRLTRRANEARQAEVTNELIDIVSGANALTAQRGE